MASLTFRWDSASVGKLSRLINRISKAQQQAENRAQTLTLPMKKEQQKVWVHNFPSGGRYEPFERGLRSITILNRIRQGYAPMPPLERSGRMKVYFAGDAGRGISTKFGVNWVFRDYDMGSDKSAMLVLHNEGGGKIRQRKFVDLNSKDREMHEQRAELWLAQLARTVASGK